MAIYESGENYLETILMLEKKTGSVRSIDIANELNFSKPSISRAMGILKNDKLITIDEKGNILLTEMGRIRANKIYERHQVILQFLVMVLGVDKDIAEQDACKIEHVISEQSFEKMKILVRENS
ncbi:metal-dependent transcriptional regulator [Cellulosilyticum sp. I15G10I2]|uniref:metal-dependent transcriptional regulator n=1 Tax=Cellulosilyticum sp. I15G10I2 TaxID=1892843 RepID=UPI00085BE919|nr:metal-dependent transcriptional regulator [Cellulosilyticum sp. I15G10I2]